MFVESRDALCCQTSSQSKHEIIEGKLSFDLAVGNRDGSFKRIDMGDFSFNEVDFSIQHGLSQVE